MVLRSSPVLDALGTISELLRQAFLGRMHTYDTLPNAANHAYTWVRNLLERQGMSSGYLLIPR
jgi:hypothetical protein